MQRIAGRESNDASAAAAALVLAAALCGLYNAPRPSSSHTLAGLLILSPSLPPRCIHFLIVKDFVLVGRRCEDYFDDLLLLCHFDLTHLTDSYSVQAIDADLTLYRTWTLHGISNPVCSEPITQAELHSRLALSACTIRSAFRPGVLSSQVSRRARTSCHVTH